MAFEQFNMNMDDYNNQLAELENNKKQDDKPREYKDAPDGIYECTLRNLEIGTNKAGNKLMLKGAFKITDNPEHYGNLFLNKVLTGTKNDAWCIKSAVDFLNSLGGMMEVEFNGDFDDLSKQVEIVFADISNCTFFVQQETKNDFKNLSVIDVFE